MSHSVEDINKAYVSPYDEFMAAFDQKHKPSLSQLQEIKKHKRISYLRDNPDPTLAKGKVWDQF